LIARDGVVAEIVGGVSDWEEFVGGVGVGHADFLQDAAGGGIVREVVGGDLRELELGEGEMEHGGGGFGGVAVVPMGNAEPVAEGGMVDLRGIFAGEADPAD
jgi:hypothetical protein